MPLRHALLAAAVAAVWGVNFVVVHVGLESFPPLLFAALRFVVLALPGLLIVRRGPGIPARWVIAIGLSLSTAQFGLLFTAMDQGLPAGLASLVLQLQVMFTILLAVAFLGERPSAVQLAGVAVALGGMGIIAAGREGDVPLAALGLCVLAAVGWGIGNVCTRVARPPDPIALLVWAALVPPIPLGLLSLWLEGPAEIGDALAGIDASGVLAMTYVVLGASVFGYGIWTWLLRRHEASKVAPFTLLVPPVGIAAAWIALGETPNAAELGGAVVVLGGLALTTGALRPRTAAARPLAADAPTG